MEISGILFLDIVISAGIVYGVYTDCSHREVGHDVVDFPAAR